METGPWTTTPLGSDERDEDSQRPSWPEFLLDMVSRLPDPDRPARRGWEVTIRERYALTILMLHWCSMAPDDFRPPLPSNR